MYLLFFLITVGCKSVNCESDDIVILKSKDSFLVGKRLTTVFENKPYAAFWRIPYAEPPLRDLRFKPPKKHDPWVEDITYDHSRPYNNTCSSGLTEDCLYLSVYMPLSDKLTTNHSVLVWIHEQSNLHEPDFFIDEDVLVVAVSYRTGILGFLNTEDEFAEGNMGAKDVIMALKWIKDNIKVFNGDVNKVTIAGSGEAAAIVASCLVSKAAEDLFNRAIIQSGSALSPADYAHNSLETLKKLYWKLNENRDFDKEKLYEMLIKAKLKNLRKLSVNLFDTTEVRDRQRLINSFPLTVETHNKNAFINKHPIDVYKRKMSNNNVDVMIGYMNLESIYKLKGFVKNRKLLKYLNYNFQYLLPFEGRADGFGSARYKRIEKRIMDFYFVNGTIGESSLRRYAKYASDLVIYPLVRQARLHVATSCNNVYLYRFSYRGNLNVGWDSLDSNLPGATAGDEICYLFRCKSAYDVYASPEANESRFIKKMARLWANFAKCGNPTPDTRDDILEGLQWKPLPPNGKLKGMQLAKNMKMATLPEEKRIRFWDDLRKDFFEDKDLIKIHYEL